MSRAGQKSFATVIAMTLTAALVAPALAQQQATGPACQNVSGSISANFVDDAAVLGTVTGDLHGAVTATVLSQTEGEGGAVHLELQHVFLTESGDLLRTTDMAMLTPVGEGIMRMTTDYVITGGSGGFEGVTGTLQNHGEVDMNRGVLTLRYRGEVCGG